MCGIAGILQPPGNQVSAELLNSMGRITGHRGPDNFGCVITGSAGLTHNRLSLLDLSIAGNQPFTNAGYVLTYNGEIYNYRELRESLKLRHGVAFKTTSDTEVLFYLLIHEGIDQCLKQIKGMFAFAFFDKARKELILARDRFGIKPLYFLSRGNGFYWASEMKVLARTFDLIPDPIRTFFAVGGSGERYKTKTLFKDIYSLESGTYIRIDRSLKVRHMRYFETTELLDSDYSTDLGRKSSEAIVSEFDDLFTASVERMMVSDAPMGAFVSGGVDSGLISAIAKLSNPDVKLFTANVVGRYSEFEAARTVADHIDAELYDYRFEPEMFLRDWAETTYFYESPIVVHTNAVPFGNVAKLARDTGVKAVLTGEGADELFMGYPKLLTERYKGLAMLPDQLLKSLYKMVPGLSDYLFPTPENNIYAFLGKLARNFDSQRTIEHCEEVIPFLDLNLNEHKMIVKLMEEHLSTLLHRNDRMGMMGSIEARFPFLDEDVVKFAVNMPSKYKIGRSFRFHNYKHPFLIDKWVVRRAADKHLPKQIVYKKKFGFGMFGHKHIRVLSKFFKNGWFSETLDWDSKTIDYMVESQPPYFVAKLASVEIFGRIFAHRERLSDVTSNVLKNITLDKTAHMGLPFANCGLVSILGSMI